MSGLATMRAMIELGLTDEQKMLLLEAIEADAGPARSSGAERQRRYRERQKENVTRDVTRDGNERNAVVSLDKETPQTPKKLNPSVCVGISPRARDWHRLPDDWQPTRALTDRLQAKVDQWPPGAWEDELAAFHRWAANAENKRGKGLKLDWDKAWQNWIERRHDERYGKQGSGSSASGMGRTIDAAQRFVARGGPH